MARAQAEPRSSRSRRWNQHLRTRNGRIQIFDWDHGCVQLLEGMITLFILCDKTHATDGYILASKFLFLPCIYGLPKKSGLPSGTPSFLKMS